MDNTSVLDLFEIKLNDFDGYFRFHGSKNLKSNIIFKQKEYLFIPCEISNLEYSSEAKQNRPTLSIANINNYISNLIKDRKDLIGKRFYRKKILTKDLDDVNFGGSNKNTLGASSFSSFISVDTFVIQKKNSENKEQDKAFVEFRNQVFNGKKYEFVLFFNSRNIRRKQIPDAILAFKQFMSGLSKEQADKCAMLLHTAAVDENGTDLIAVIETLCPEIKDKFYITNRMFGPNEMNYLYNMTDAQILLTSNEGWGLSLTEALLVGNPIIANVTGGMQDQMRFEFEDGTWIDFDADFPSNHNGTLREHGEWAFPVYPTNRSIQGSPITSFA